MDILSGKLANGLHIGIVRSFKKRIEMKNNHLKKSYLKPELTVIDTATKFGLLAGSGEVGITSGSTPGNEYNENDQSYSRSSSYMGDEE